MLGSCRLNLALLCLLATLGFFVMRLNFSFALVCMVPGQKVNEGNSTVHDSRYSSVHVDVTESGNWFSVNHEPNPLLSAHKVNDTKIKHVKLFNNFIT